MIPARDAKLKHFEIPERMGLSSDDPREAQEDIQDVTHGFFGLHVLYFISACNSFLDVVLLDLLVL